MAPYSHKPSTHRRRSLSASAPGSPSSKRSRVHGASSSMSRWDIDVWRRGKRPRRDSLPSDVDMSTSDHHLAVPHPRKHHPRFPCTSAAFNFFPASSSRPAQSRSNPSTPGAEPHEDIYALYSSAFWELRRSIAEGDEGFIRRMKDWESSRTHSCKRAFVTEPHTSSPRRGRASAMDVTVDDALEDALDDEDDDIQIYAGEASCVGLATEPPWSSPPRKRARSLGPMDLDGEPLPPRPSTSAAPSLSISDEDIRGSFAHAQKSEKAPSLSRTGFTSSNSSLTSLSLPPADFPSAPSSVSPTAAPSTAFTFTSPFPSLPSPGSGAQRHKSMSATREEKAIAALSLALANGAGGLSDYSAVRALGEVKIDEEHVGELFH